MLSKLCRRCGEEKSSAMFSPDKRNRDGLQGYCKPCCAKASKASAQKDPERNAAVRKQYYERNEEKRRELSRKIRDRNPEVARDRARQWRAANPHAVNEASAKRRMMVAKAMPAWADKDKIRAIYFVAKFLGEMWGEPHEVDHVVPLRGRRVCGLHVHTNLRVVPQMENRTKSNRHETD